MLIFKTFVETIFNLIQSEYSTLCITKTLPINTADFSNTFLVFIF